ncbi:YcaO-like family protein [Aerococcus urinaeequi]|uniref:YcaO-like family protein n=1 Tax=Aerococcus urinaeequi TaxID=51665 RepID=UPI003D6B06CA
MYINDTFIFKNVTRIEKSLYRNQLNEVTVFDQLYDELSGHSAGYNLSKTLKAAIGEYNERWLLFNQYPKGMLFPAFSLTSNETIFVPQENFLFTNFSYMDSLGEGSGISSKYALNSALLEFFERQSLLFHWIYQLKAKKISEIEYQNLLPYEKLTNPKIKVYDISIFPNIFVIFIIGTFNKNQKVIGCAADFNLENALSRAFKEVYEIFSGVNFSFKNVDEDRTLEKKVFGKLTPKELIDAYSFLDQGIDVPKPLNRFIRTKVSKKKLLQIIEKFYQIKLFCIKVPNDIGNLKVIKIFSPKGVFKHMNVSIFTEEELNYFNKFMLEVKNTKEIPFP